MKIYLVGGAVRDALLGLPVGDRDWVVVGGTPAQMLQAGYLQVGKDFPVFLHPQSREEYALARTERKIGQGYHGFAFAYDPDVTLPEDLSRRDLTINAIAQDDDGTLIDPYGGQADLTHKLLRHVSDAFAEDPVRILRLARFAARFVEFSVADETMQLCQRMVQAGEVDALVAERVWQEVARGLLYPQPSRMFAVLADCGALARVMPELDTATVTRLGSRLDRAARLKASLPMQWSVLTGELDPDTALSLARRLRVPKDCTELAAIVARERDAFGQVLRMDADALVEMQHRCDAWRRLDRFEHAFQAWLALRALPSQGPDGHTAPAVSDDEGHRIWQRLHASCIAAASVDAGAVTERLRLQLAPGDKLAGPAIADAVRQARVQAVAHVVTQVVAQAAAQPKATPED